VNGINISCRVCFTHTVSCYKRTLAVLRSGRNKFSLPGITGVVILPITVNLLSPLSLFQEIKQLKQDAIDSEDQQFNDRSETIAQVTLAQRDAESAIMRLGMALKYCAEPNPYPESKNPESQVVEKTADNLKM